MAKRKPKRTRKARKKVQAGISAMVRRRVNAVLDTLLETWIQDYSNNINPESEVVAQCSLIYGSGEAKLLEKIANGDKNAESVFVPVYVGSVRLGQAFALPGGRYYQLESGLIVPEYIIEITGREGRPYDKARAQHLVTHLRYDTILMDSIP